ncbi:anti-sigma factor [Pararhizobium mangrovi]|uniref:Anti-sigma factor n=1 Tax=Pararhizobium mangrovi TaxID=2590452 RepID=A0A506TWD5_9HYPH|nr:anti-sigma factor [Pararhizobium mangrovi]TPW25790.1 anti-sigma factor [Pararhizobium mangrovi]
MTSEEAANGGSDDRVVAGEYVLGTLPLDARRIAEARIAREPAFAALVERWENDLSGFNDAYEVAEPPRHGYAGIERRLFGETRERRGSWLRSLAMWRGATAVLLVAVVGLSVALVGLSRTAPEGMPLVAHLDADQSPIDLVAHYRSGSGQLTLQPVAAGAQEPKSLELWMFNGQEPPVSLGVLPENGEGEVVVPEEMRSHLKAGSTLAVSLEPKGGSTTGAPSGPVVASGPAQSL